MNAHHTQGVVVMLLLVVFAVTAVTAQVPAPPVPPPAFEPLRHAAGSRVFVGAMANHWQLQNASDPKYRATHSEQYSMVTAESECKWHSTEPEQGNYTLDACEAVLRHAQNSTQEFRGHNLAWGNSNPAWLQNGSFTPAQLRSLLERHIGAVAGGLSRAGRIYCWDVVNEAVTDQSPFGLKRNVWYPAVPDYIDVAFNATRRADPSTKLFYNEYGTETVDEKSTYVLNMLTAMRARGLQVDGVGFQFHVTVKVAPTGRVSVQPFAPNRTTAAGDNSDSTSGEGAAPPKPEMAVGDFLQSVAQNFQRFADAGFELHVTEMDVRCDGCNATGLQHQAAVYAGVLRACLGAPRQACRNFETWGFTDRYTWLWNYNNPNHTNTQPLPFDIDYNPKPAVFSLLGALKQGTGET